MLHYVEYICAVSRLLRCQYSLRLKLKLHR